MYRPQQRLQSRSVSPPRRSQGTTPYPSSFSYDDDDDDYSPNVTVSSHSSVTYSPQNLPSSRRPPSYPSSYDNTPNVTVSSHSSVTYPHTSKNRTSSSTPSISVSSHSSVSISPHTSNNQRSRSRTTSTPITVSSHSSVKVSPHTSNNQPASRRPNSSLAGTSYLSSSYQPSIVQPQRGRSISPPTIYSIPSDDDDDDDNPFSFYSRPTEQQRRRSNSSTSPYYNDTPQSNFRPSSNQSETFEDFLGRLAQDRDDDIFSQYKPKKSSQTSLYSPPSTSPPSTSKPFIFTPLPTPSSLPPRPPATSLFPLPPSLSPAPSLSPFPLAPSPFSLPASPFPLFPSPASTPSTSITSTAANDALIEEKAKLLLEKQQAEEKTKLETQQRQRIEREKQQAEQESQKKLQLQQLKLATTGAGVLESSAALDVLISGTYTYKVGIVEFSEPVPRAEQKFAKLVKRWRRDPQALGLFLENLWLSKPRKCAMKLQSLVDHRPSHKSLIDAGIFTRLYDSLANPDIAPSSLSILFSLLSNHETHAYAKIPEATPQLIDAILQHRDERLLVFMDKFLVGSEIHKRGIRSESLSQTLQSSLLSFHYAPQIARDLQAPWHIPEELLLNLGKDKPYITISGQPRDCEFVARLYQRCPVPGFDIKSVTIVHNQKLFDAFVARIHLMNQRHGNPSFQSHWRADTHTSLDEMAQREQAHAMFQELSKPHYYKAAPHVSFLPAWHGTKSEVLDSLFSTGFANLAATDVGFFGKGLYTTPDAEYAHRVYAAGVLLINWVAAFNTFPVIGVDEESLQEKGNFKNYDAHFVPVYSSSHPRGISYHACQFGEVAQYSEIVVFESAQMFPHYIVELQPNMPREIDHEKIDTISSNTKDLTQESKPDGTARWSVLQVCAWAAKLPLSQDYTSVLRANNIAGDVLLGMDEKDWDKIGVKIFGDIRLLTRNVERLKSGLTTEPSAPSASKSSFTAHQAPSSSSASKSPTLPMENKSATTSITCEFSTLLSVTFAKETAPPPPESDTSTTPAAYKSTVPEECATKTSDPTL